MIVVYKYETHLHTSPVSRCAKAGVRESLEFYKRLGYHGVCVTNHFLDGSLNIDVNKSYEEKIEFHFSDYEKAVEIGKEIGINVFCGIESDYLGADFLIYGPDKAWYLAHPEIMQMKRIDLLALMVDSGALVIHAHPFREAPYIEHIHLFPRSVHGVEIINSGRKDAENDMAKLYAEHYGLLPFAGSDNHFGPEQKKLAGIYFDEPISCIEEFIENVKNGKAKVFSTELE